VARLVEARIRGLRTLADVTLQLGGLTVLIGDNGAGKSSILEVLRIASLLVRPNFVEVLGQHMLASAIRKDAGALKFDLRVEAGDRNLVYSVSLDPSVRGITHESLHDLPRGLDLRSGASSTAAPVLIRTSDDKLKSPDGKVNQHVHPGLTMFEYFGRAPDLEAIGIVREACEGIDVHLPFRVSATWANRSTGQGSPLREPRIVEPGRRLELFGANLTTVYQMLKNSGAERWREKWRSCVWGSGPSSMT
jgi:predicted ATPase